MLTFRDIRDRFPTHTTHQIRYAIDEYRIDHRDKVGPTRVWSEEDIPRIEAALRRIAQRQGAVHA